MLTEVLMLRNAIVVIFRLGGGRGSSFAGVLQMNEAPFQPAQIYLQHQGILLWDFLAKGGAGYSPRYCSTGGLLFLDGVTLNTTLVTDPDTGCPAPH